MATETLNLNDETIVDTEIPIFNQNTIHTFGQFTEMTTVQINALTSLPPRIDTFIYNTDINQLVFWNGSSWQKITSTAM